MRLSYVFLLLLIVVYYEVGAFEGTCTPRTVNEIFQNSAKLNYKTAASTILPIASCLFPKISNAQVEFDSNECDFDRFKKTVFNLPPKETKYPKSFEGTWLATFNFAGAKFTEKIPLQQLSTDVNVAGFRKYSVAFFPDIGSDFIAAMLFRESKAGGDIVEDRAVNLKSLMESSIQNVVCDVDSIVYDPSDNPNRCTVKYHDSKGEGRLELFTNSRTQQTFGDDKFSSFETIRESSVRINNQQRASQMYVDYGIAWDLQYGPNDMKGTVKVSSYLIPQDELYFVRPERPVGVFTYNVKMTKVV